MHLMISLAMFITICSTCFGQERNFEMTPNLGCDVLERSFASVEQATARYKETQFRVSESFVIRREKGLRSGNFYSCDDVNGHLVLLLDDNEVIYFNVPKGVWEGLISSREPEIYLQQEINDKFKKLE